MCRMNLHARPWMSVNPQPGQRCMDDLRTASVFHPRREWASAMHCHSCGVMLAAALRLSAAAAEDNLRILRHANFVRRAAELILWSEINEPTFAPPAQRGPNFFTSPTQVNKLCIVRGLRGRTRPCLTSCHLFHSRQAKSRRRTIMHLFTNANNA